MRVEVVDELDELVPVLRPCSDGEAEQLVVVRGLRGILGDAPDLEEAAVVGEDRAAVVDDEDAVERGLLLRAQDGDGGAQRLVRRARAAAAQPACERASSVCEMRGRLNFHAGWPGYFRRVSVPSLSVGAVVRAEELPLHPTRPDVPGHEQGDEELPRR